MAKGKHRKEISTTKKATIGLITFIAVDYMIGGIIVWAGYIPIK